MLDIRLPILLYRCALLSDCLFGLLRARCEPWKVRVWERPRTYRLFIPLIEPFGYTLWSVCLIWTYEVTWIHQLVNCSAIFSRRNHQPPLWQISIIALHLSGHSTYLSTATLPPSSELGASARPNRDSSQSTVTWLLHRKSSLSIGERRIYPSTLTPRRDSSDGFCTGANPHR